MKRLILSIVLFAVSSAVMAASVPNGPDIHAFAPPVGDASVGFLREIFGNIVDTIVANGNSQGAPTDTALGAMLKPFNSAILFLGMLFIFYTIVKGTVDTAHDGEILGKKMSSIWIPLRSAGGTALLLPLGSGYSLIQIAVLWLAIQGAGIGDSILIAGLNYVAETGMVSRPNLPDARPLAANVLRYSVCAAAMNKQFSDSGQSTRIAPMEKTWLVSNVGEVGVGDVVTAAGAGMIAGPLGSMVSAAGTAANVTYRVTEFYWAANDNTYENPNVCGALNWQESDQSTLGGGNTEISKRQIMQAQAQATRDMINELYPVAQQITNFEKPTPGAIETAATHYENTLRVAGQSAIAASGDAGREKFIQSAKDSGWIFVSTWYNNLIQLNDVMQSALNTLPTSKPIDIESKEVKERLATYNDAMAVTEEYLKHRDIAVKDAYNQQASDDISLPRSWDDIKRLLSRPAEGAINQMTQAIAGTNLSHVGQIKSVGDIIITGGESIIAANFIAAGLANANPVKVTADNFFNIGAALSSINGIITTIVTLILVFGATCAFYIPMIPFIAGISAIIKWFILVFEAVIAAPIWAVAHIHPDGDDAVGKAGPGYMLILGLILWPALVVFGFFGSIWISGPTTMLVNLGYMTAVAGAQHNSFTGIVAFVAYVAIYTTLMTIVIHSVFTLVNWLPNNVLRWIGGALNAQGIADKEGDEAGHSFNAGLVNIRHGAGGGGHKPTTPTGNGGGDEGGGGNSNGLSQAEKDRENREHLGG